MNHDRELRLLVAIDDSQSSVTVLKHLKTRCWPKDTEFLVISVDESFEIDQRCAKRYPGVAYCAASFVRLHFLTELVEYSVIKLKETLRSDNIKSIVTEGNAADSIIKVASKWHADEIFIGCRDKSDPLFAKRKSVSDKVLQGANCSVTIVKEPPVKRKPSSSDSFEQRANFAEVDSYK
jgi:nucleotide-binding universal stress UspA family protein